MNMIPIILFGRKEDSGLAAGFSSGFKKALQMNGGAFFISEKEVDDGNAGDVKYLIYETGYPAEFRLSSGIIVFKSGMSRFIKMKIPPGFSAVVQSDNGAALEVLKKAGIPAITCGMSARDTLSVSSIDESCALLSLQRDLRGLDGNIREATEISVKLTGKTDRYALLASCAVMLLSGDCGEEVVI